MQTDVQRSAETCRIPLLRTCTNIFSESNQNFCIHFRENSHFVFWCPSEGPLCSVLKYLYSQGTDIWQINFWIPNMQKGCPTIQAPARHTSVPADRQHSEAHFFIFGGRALKTCKSIKISGSPLTEELKAKNIYKKYGASEDMYCLSSWLWLNNALISRLQILILAKNYEPVLHLRLSHRWLWRVQSSGI